MYEHLGPGEEGLQFSEWFHSGDIRTMQESVNQGEGTHMADN